jgi:hypothetical protein
MSMKLYLIRHGQSETNLRKCFTGWAQVALTEQGRAGAVGVRPMLEKIKFDKIYSSDLIRAMHTAELAIPGCAYETTPLLREVGMGSLELQPIAEVEADMREKNTRQLGYAMYGGDWSMTLTWMINGALFDTVHMVGNLTSSLLVIPLVRLLFKLSEKKYPFSPLTSLRNKK